MFQDTDCLFVGIDAHQDTLSIAVLPLGAERPEPARRIANDASKIRRVIRQLQERGSLHAVYEAGCTGFVLWRQLTQLGVDCLVAAPSRIPVLPGERRKTDRLDAERLAVFLRGGQLTAVRPPTPELEALRTLTRSRDAARKDVVAAKHHISKLLLHRGAIWRGGALWSRAHRSWLRQVELDDPDDRVMLALKLRRLAARESELQELDELIEERAQREDIAEQIRALKAFRGVQTLVATNVVAELGDPHRFPNHASVAAYVGLVPSENSSGNRVRRGGITRTGSRHLRRLLVETCQHYRRLYPESKSLRQRRAQAPAAASELARRVERRLVKKYQRLSAAKHTNLAKAAIARELAGHLWQALREAS
ncbi:MAG: IS110 family transposase [Planctomycetota bacterium]